MSISDAIQIGILVIALGTLLIVARQTRLQNRLLSAQLLRDRFDMYWKMYEPVTADQVAEFKVLPDDFIDPQVYKSKYEGNDLQIRKYIAMMQVYEYLAFAYGLEVLGLPDPLGYEWTKRWARDLVADNVFCDIHRYHGVYYPHFARFVDNEIGMRRQSEPTTKGGV